MLVLTRKESERLVIGQAVVTILAMHGNRVSIGIEAPREVEVMRGELVDRERDEQDAA